MFVDTGTLRKPKEYREARRLRREEGTPIKRIAKRLGVSAGTVHAWCRDIELTPEQLHRNQFGPRGPQNPEHIAARADAWRRKNQNRRLCSQLEGRLRAHDMQALHIAGCMLYWAEGAKARNTLMFANSELSMIKLFCRFLRECLRECFDVPDERITLRLNVYTGNGLSLEQIEDYWLSALELPRSSLRGHVLNHMPTSSSGAKKNRLPYGVAQIRVLKSTSLVQHVLGAIQEYGGFDEPRWLDGPPQKPKPRAA